MGIGYGNTSLGAPDIFCEEGKNTSGNNCQVSKNVHHVTRGIIIYHMRVRTQLKIRSVYS